MFGLMHNLYKWVKRKQVKGVTLCIIGLDNAGKTTLLHGFLNEPAGIAVPTFGFSSETVTRREYTVTFYDLGGGGTIRGIWKQYYAEVHGTVFVVDAADKARFPEAADALRAAMEDPLLAGKPVLVLANKQDLPEARSADEISEQVDLPSILPDTPHRILHCTALRPQAQVDGANPAPLDPQAEVGWDWLLGEIDRQFAALSSRVNRDIAAQKERLAQELREKRARVEQTKAERRAAREGQGQGRQVQAETHAGTQAQVREKANPNGRGKGKGKTASVSVTGDHIVPVAVADMVMPHSRGNSEDGGGDSDSIDHMRMDPSPSRSPPTMAHRAARVPEIRFRPEAADLPVEMSVSTSTSTSISTSISVSASASGGGGGGRGGAMTLGGSADTGMDLDVEAEAEADADGAVVLGVLDGVGVGDRERERGSASAHVTPGLVMSGTPERDGTPSLVHLASRNRDEGEQTTASAGLDRSESGHESARSRRKPNSNSMRRHDSTGDSGLLPNAISAVDGEDDEGEDRL